MTDLEMSTCMLKTWERYKRNQHFFWGGSPVIFLSARTWQRSLASRWYCNGSDTSVQVLNNLPGDSSCKWKCSLPRHLAWGQPGSAAVLRDQIKQRKNNDHQVCACAHACVCVCCRSLNLSFRCVCAPWIIHKGEGIHAPSLQMLWTLFFCWRQNCWFMVHTSCEAFHHQGWVHIAYFCWGYFSFCSVPFWNSQKTKQLQRNQGKKEQMYNVYKKMSSKASKGIL